MSLALPKVDVAHWDMVRKWVESGHQYADHHGQDWGTSAWKDTLHNFEDRSGRYVIPSTELFLGHFVNTPRNQRSVTVLDKESALGNFDDRLHSLSEQETIEEVRRAALPTDIASRLSNATQAPIDASPIEHQPVTASIYQLDGIVRRAPSLQLTADARGA